MLVMKKIDIKGGKFTYTQRIELGKIIASETTDYDKFTQILKCLNIRQSKSILLLGYFEEIIEGLQYWFERESVMLRYEPSMEEVAAGIQDYSKNIGDFGTVKSLAKAYNQDPDTILNWEYGKVFGILYTDLEEYKYNQRYNRELEKKYARKH